MEYRVFYFHGQFSNHFESISARCLYVLKMRYEAGSILNKCCSMLNNSLPAAVATVKAVSIFLSTSSILAPLRMSKSTISPWSEWRNHLQTFHLNGVSNSNLLLRAAENNADLPDESVSSILTPFWMSWITLVLSPTKKLQ